MHKTSRFVFFISILLSLFIGACGGDPPAPVTENACSQKTINAAKISGRFYKQPKGTGLTAYNRSNPLDKSVQGIGGASLNITFSGGVTKEVKTCDSGYFSYNDFSQNIGVIDYNKKDCTTNNCPTKFAGIITNDAKQSATHSNVKVVTFGDSIPAFPTGKEHFPAKFKKLVASLVDVDNQNISVPGSTTDQWLPTDTTKAYFSTKLATVQNADVFVFTLGGNDVLNIIDQIAAETNPATQMSLASTIPTVAATAIDNIKKIIDEIRKNNPDADIVWISYLDYTETLPIIKSYPDGPLKLQFINMLKGILENQRKAIAGYKNTMVLDVNGYLASHPKKPDNSTLTSDQIVEVDGIHLNQEGHELYAELLFQLLGGFIIDKGLGKTHYVGYP